MHQEKATLQRQLKPMHVWAVAFGCIVGWGSFINPGKKFLPNSGVAGTAIAMALGALVMIIIAFSYAYMVPKYPQAGGEFTFTKMCFGKRAAYVCGWVLVAAYLTNVPMNSTAIGLIVDGLDGSADILKFGFHYQIAGFDVWLGEMLLAMGILILFGLLNIWGVKKAGIVQSILAALLAASVFTLTAAALISSKANGINMHPIWGFDKSAALAAGAGAANISDFAHTGGKGITSAILATFAIAPWAFVGFDTIPQTAEEFKFSYKKVSGIMIVAILFGCFVYTANNTVAAAALRGVGTEQDAEEAAADAFVYLWEHPEKFDPRRGSLKTWLSVVARSRALDRSREILRCRAVSLEEIELADPLGVPEALLAGERRAALNAAVDALAEPDREILLRRYYFGQKPREIAAALGLDKKQVDNRLYQTKRRLRASVTGAEGE